MPGDLEPLGAIAIAQLATTLIAASIPSGFDTSTWDATERATIVSASVALAHDVLDATCLEVCKRTNAARRREDIARGSVVKGGDS